MDGWMVRVEGDRLSDAYRLTRLISPRQSCVVTQRFHLMKFFAHLNFFVLVLGSPRIDCVVLMQYSAACAEFLA